MKMAFITRFYDGKAQGTAVCEPGDILETVDVGGASDPPDEKESWQIFFRDITQEQFDLLGEFPGW